MKSLIFGLLLATVTVDSGAIPETIAGFVYHEDSSHFHVVLSTARVFATDGTFTGLYNIGFLLPDPPRLSDPDNGTYVYKKLDEQTAELILTDATGASRTETLHFESDWQGHAQDPTSAFTSVFRFAPLASSAPLANSSNRSFVRAGSASFCGFVVTRPEGATVLVRAIGPGLASFGISDFLRQPVLQVRDAKTSVALGTNSAWSSESALAISRTSAALGAFALPTGSSDAALILRLAPGVYVSQVNSGDPAGAGEAMIEVYVLP